jgi:hypothetical protein
MPLFTFPGEPRWNAEREAVEFAVELGEYRGLVIVPQRVLRGLLGQRPTPEACVAYLHLHRTEFERIAEAKLRARTLGEDANVHIDGRDLRRAPRG